MYHLCVRYFLYKLSCLIFSVILCCEEILVLWKLRLEKRNDESHKAGERTELWLAVTPGLVFLKSVYSTSVYCTPTAMHWEGTMLSKLSPCHSFSNFSLLHSSVCLCSGLTLKLRVCLINRHHSRMEGAMREVRIWSPRLPRRLCH